MSTENIEQCPEFPYFGASYPDARCVSGYLHDMDSCDEHGNLYVMSESNPCPFCNTKEFLKNQRDNEADMTKVKKWMENIKNEYSYK